MNIKYAICGAALLCGVSFGDLLGYNSKSNEFEVYSESNRTSTVIGSSTVDINHLTKVTSGWIGLTVDGTVVEYTLFDGELIEYITSNTIKMNGNYHAINNRLSKYYPEIDMVSELWETSRIYTNGWRYRMDAISIIPEPTTITMFIFSLLVVFGIKRLHI